MTAAQRAPRGDAGPTEGELHPAGDWVGTRLPRKEDPRLLRGRGRFVDDIERAGLLHACFVRSPHASAEIAGLDLTRTREAAGVVAALTGEDLGSPGLTAILQREEFTPTRMPILAQRRVRYVGEPLAIVLAGDPYLAEDGAELAQADYRVRSAVSSAAAATATDAPRVHEELIGNTFLDFSPFTDPGIDEVFASAPCVVTVRTHTGRQNAMPLEPRGCLAEWVDRDEQLVLHVSTQVPHQVRTAVARCLGLAESAVRVIAGDVGGGFGMKCVVGREEIAVAAAALRLRRGVKWIEDRRDGLIASVHGREQSYLARAAFDEQGQILALDAQIDCDVGAYSVFPFTSGVEPLMAATELPGVYRVPRYRVRSRGIATNKAPTAPYRGVSRPQIVLVMERLMERAAEELGIDSLALRRINLIDTFPYVGVNGITYDPGSYRESLDTCAQWVRRRGWDERKQREGAERAILGIGYSCFNERTAYGTDAFAQRTMPVVPGYDIAEVRMDPSGSVIATTGTSAHGQGHETTLAQIVADRLGLHPDAVRIRQGDTDLVAYGWGTFGSRSAAIGGGAVRIAATRLGEQLKQIAAHRMDIEPGEVELVDGLARRIGHPQAGLPLAQIAESSYLRAHDLPKGIEPGLWAQAVFDVATAGTFSNATHAALVRLDSGTGRVEILDYLVVEDCGVVINPTIVDGQVRGGVAQGIAGTLYEEMRYDSDGQPTTASLMDYLVPTACEVPEIAIEHLQTPCEFSETGAKGMGEGGTIGAPAAIVNAVNDALRRSGAELDSIPITPELVYQAMERNR